MIGHFIHKLCKWAGELIVILILKIHSFKNDKVKEVIFNDIHRN